MLNFKKSVFYFVLVSFFSAIIYWYLTIGVALEKVEILSSQKVKNPISWNLSIYDL